LELSWKETEAAAVDGEECSPVRSDEYGLNESEGHKQCRTTAV